MFIFKIIFWICLFGAVYPFVLYVPLLKLLVSIGSRHKKGIEPVAVSWPKVLFVISAYNEENAIRAKLKNALETDYPQEKFDIVVISDASNDDTDTIVREMAKQHRNIRLHRQDVRKGKTAGLTEALSEAVADIIVFSDANAMYETKALKELVKGFNNKEVGYVVGAAVYNPNAENTAYESENTYWDRELELKQLESDFYSVVGGDGAIYAIRRELFWRLQEDDINDFANPLQIIARGYKGIFNPNAVCFENTAEDFSGEYRRKRRIVNRSFRAFTRYIGNFNIRRHYKFLFMLISHKLLRWFNMFFIIGVAGASLVLCLTGAGFVYVLCFAGILLSLLLALLGKHYNRKRNCPKLLYLSYYFFLVSIAGMQGIIDNFKGKYHVTWEHIRK